MKKFGVYILLFTIIANLFAPISLQKNNQNKNTIQINTVSAEEKPPKPIKEVCSGSEYCSTISSRYLSSKPDPSGKIESTGILYVAAAIQTKYLSDRSVDGLFVVVRIKDSSNKIISMYANTDGTLPMQEYVYDLVLDKTYKVYEAVSFPIKGLTPNTKYNIEIITTTANQAGLNRLKDRSEIEKDLEQKLKKIDPADPAYDKVYADIIKISSNEFTTPKENESTTKTGINTSTNKESVDSVMPACAVLPQWAGGSDGTIMGCVAQLLYYVLFVPSSFLFALAGKFFDFAFHYSIQDTSYRLGFVTEGWKIVRDLCNMFFIFLLLTAAIKMILNIGHGEKSTIVKVIIIGLLINFSLFTTQVVIDGSNILARLFYNSDAISVAVTGGKDTRGGISVVGSVYGNGELPLSAAIVDKVDPQAIIISAKRINIQSIDNGAIQNPNGQDSQQGNQGIGVGPFVLIVFITTAINLLGFFVFISVALIFVGRVVGLWFSMIFVPLAFFSYAAPNLPEGLSRFGWKSWWSELLGTAFVAPVFMFMLYLILLFLSKGFVGLFDADSNGPEFVLQTIVPFIVIMILLWQAKSVASDMSKGVASAATTGLKVAGGAALALGGAGVGWAGRNVIGKTMAKASSGTTATQKYETARAALTTAGGRDPSLYNALSRKEKILGNIGSKLQLGKVFGKTQVTAAVDERGRRIANTASVGGVQGGIGGAINKSQKKVGGINHAAHDYEETAKDAHIDPERKYKDLSEIEKGNMKKSFYSLNKSKFETKIKNGLVDGTESESDYKDRNRAAAIQALGPNATTAEKNAVETKLSNDYKTVVLEPALRDKLSHDFTHTMEGASEKISFKDRITSDAPSGTYNPLNISKLSATKNDTLSTQLIFGITSAVALGMRSGMKSISGVSMGSGSRKLTDDLKNAFTEAIKGVNIKLESPGGGGGHGGGHDDHGGGHDDHGHGGH